ncbi:hypothetical protein Ancab_002332 [Ancistrocladus abbreviatus]
MDREGEIRTVKRDIGSTKLETSYADMARRSPKSLHSPKGEQHQASVFSSSKSDLLWLEGSFTGFLKDHISLTMLREGLQKEGLTDCVAPIRAPCSDDSPLSDTLEPTERSSLGSPNKAHSQSHGVEALSNGAGEKGADLAGPSSINQPSAGPPHIKLVSRPTKPAQKKHLEDILQLRLSKRVICKGKKNRKVELTNLIGDDTGVNFGTSSFGDSLHDSHIMNRNQVLMAGNEHLGNGSPGLSPLAICAILSQLGVVKESNVEETVQWIADMEMRDALLFSSTDQDTGTFFFCIHLKPWSTCFRGPSAVLSAFLMMFRRLVAFTVGVGAGQSAAHVRILCGFDLHIWGRRQSYWGAVVWREIWVRYVHMVVLRCFAGFFSTGSYWLLVLDS